MLLQKNEIEAIRWQRRRKSPRKRGCWPRQHRESPRPHSLQASRPDLDTKAKKLLAVLKPKYVKPPKKKPQFNYITDVWI